MNRFCSIFILPCVILFLTSCGYFSSSSETSEEDPIARVHESYLYPSDLEGLIAPGMTNADSVGIINRFVQSWVRQQLLLTRAEDSIDLDEVDIERRVEAYRYQLIAHAYEKDYVKKHLDTLITPEQIQEYYKQNPQNFELKQNIVKCYYMKVPNVAPKKEMVRDLINSTDSLKIEQLKKYSYSYADASHFSDSLWLDFDVLIANTPFATLINSPVQALKRQNYFYTVDSAFAYHIRIKDYRINSETSPIDFVEDQIKNIIINKRKLELKLEHENQIFEEATRKKYYEIYE